MSPDHPAEDARECHCGAPVAAESDPEQYADLGPGAHSMCERCLPLRCDVEPGVCSRAEDAREAGDGLVERLDTLEKVRQTLMGAMDDWTTDKVWKQITAAHLARHLEPVVAEMLTKREREIGQRLLGKLLIERQTRPTSLETVEWLNELLGRIEAEFRALAGPLDEDE